MSTDYFFDFFVYNLFRITIMLKITLKYHVLKGGGHVSKISIDKKM